MNNLSLMLYFASLTDAIKVVFFLLGGLLCFVFIMGFLFRHDTSRVHAYDYENTQTWKEWWRYKFWTAAILWPLFVLIAVFVPNSTTLYLITASQFGETIINNKDAADVMTQLKARILRELQSDAK